jgi:ParB family chromosome partitioning protein
VNCAASALSAFAIELPEPKCPIHHARKPKPANDAAIKAEQEKRRHEEAIAQVTGLRVLSAITEAVPVRLMN